MTPRVVPVANVLTIIYTGVPADVSANVLYYIADVVSGWLVRKQRRPQCHGNRFKSSVSRSSSHKLQHMLRCCENAKKEKDYVARHGCREARG